MVCIYVSKVARQFVRGRTAIPKLSERIALPPHSFPGGSLIWTGRSYFPMLLEALIAHAHTRYTRGRALYTHTNVVCLSTWRIRRLQISPNLIRSPLHTAVTFSLFTFSPVLMENSIPNSLFQWYIRDLGHNSIKNTKQNCVSDPWTLASRPRTRTHTHMHWLTDLSGMKLLSSFHRRKTADVPQSLPSGSPARSGLTSLFPDILEWPYGLSQLNRHIWHIQILICPLAWALCLMVNDSYMLFSMYCILRLTGWS